MTASNFKYTSLQLPVLDKEIDPGINQVAVHWSKDMIAQFSAEDLIQTFGVSGQAKLTAIAIRSLEPQQW